MKAIILSMIKWAVDSFDKSIENATRILSGELTLNQSVDAIWSLVQNSIMPAFTGFAMTIIVICLLLELAQVTAKVDAMKFEVGIKLAVKLVLAKVAVENAPTVLLAMWRQAGVFVRAVRPASSKFGAGIYDSVAQYVDVIEGTTASIGLFGSTIVLALALAACGLIITAMAYGRFFEILVYLAVSPIPIAFLPLGTGDGSGFSRTTSRFLKSFAAVCLQGAMMLVCIYVFSLILGTASQGLELIDVPVKPIGNPNTNRGEWMEWREACKAVIPIINSALFAMLSGSVVLVMSISKCGTWAKSILDAN